VQCTLSKS